MLMWKMKNWKSSCSVFTGQLIPGILTVHWGPGCQKFCCAVGREGRLWSSPEQRGGTCEPEGLNGQFLKGTAPLSQFILEESGIWSREGCCVDYRQEAILFWSEMLLFCTVVQRTHSLLRHRVLCTWPLVVALSKEPIALPDQNPFFWGSHPLRTHWVHGHYVTSSLHTNKYRFSVENFLALGCILYWSSKEDSCDLCLNPQGSIPIC